MWQDNDDRIMDILEGIGSGNKGYFPVDCPICEKKKDTYTFTEIKKMINVEVCGHGVAHVIILHMLHADCLDGGKIQRK